jgi:deoxycytidine triphosphate deaminase/polyhydroxyalkanoate synthesis regulator phasin
MGQETVIVDNSLNYAKTDGEAEERFLKYKSKDPFPIIKPALLNTADIADYVAATGMIHPFKPEKLKSASYEIEIGGEVLYWSEDEDENHIENFSSEEITFHKNSITYVSVASKFRLPDYIALRFNLQIEHVHRGLLLGTGPLINPGFRGRLMIPIHNLTSNDYKIKAGTDLIGVEFTKISHNERWSSDIDNPREGKYQPNLMKKDNKKFKEYLRKCLPLGVGTVRSSLSSTLSDMSKQLADSKATLKKIRNLATLIGAVTIFGLFALLFTTWGIISDANKYVSDITLLSEYQSRDPASKISKEYSNLSNKLDTIRNDISRINNSIAALNKKIDDAEKSLNLDLHKEIDSINISLKDLDRRVTKIERSIEPK